MKKLLYILMLAAFLGMGSYAHAEVVQSYLNDSPKDTYTLSWGDKDASGKITSYSVTYKKNDITTPADDELVNVQINAVDNVPTQKILKGTPQEEAYFQGKIPGGQATYKTADLQAKRGGNVGSVDQSKRDAEERERLANEKEKASINLPPCLTYGAMGYPNGFNWEGCLARAGYYIFLKPAAFLLWAAAWFFNFTLGYSLNIGDFLKQVPIVDIGWKVFRDVANMCFIFILLYIAINTILQTKSADTKRMLINVIIIAILLNFSLFFAKTVIDMGNILAMQFYGKMGGTQVTSLKAFTTTNQDKGIAQTFLNGLGLSSIYENGKFGPKPVINAGNIVAITFGGAMLIMTTAFVFIVGAILFIVRTVVLVFIMILAPLAFLAMVLPQTKKYWDQWISALISQTFFASLYMMIIYLVLSIMTGKYSSNAVEGIRSATKNGKNLGTFLMGNGDSVGTLYTFIILIGLMLGALLVAKTLGAHGGDFARNIAGKATFGVGGWLGRQTAGRLSREISKTDTVGKMRNATGFAAPLSSIAGFVDKGASGSFDVRGSGIGKAAGGAVGGLGDAGGEGGFNKMFDEDKKRINENKFLEKKSKLSRALASKNGADIQEALKEFTPSEFSKLGKGILNNDLVLKNASASQRKAAMDEKNEDIDPITRAAMKQKIYKELDDAGNNSTKIKTALKKLSTDEKANIPEQLLIKPEIYGEFDKDTIKAIKGNDNITQATKDALTSARKGHLTTALNSTRGAAERKNIKAAIKNLSGEELFEEVQGRIVDQDVVANLSEEHLKELEKEGLTPAQMKNIGDLIRANKYPGYMYVKAGSPAVAASLGRTAQGEIKAGDGFEKWK